MSNSHLKCQFCFNFKVLVDLKSELKCLIDWLNPKVEANPIFLLYLLVHSQILRDYNLDLRAWDFNSKLVVVAKLSCTLAETRIHLKVEISDRLKSGNFLSAFHCKSDAVWYTSCSFYYFVNYFITYCTVFKANYVHHTICFYRIFLC